MFLSSCFSMSSRGFVAARTPPHVHDRELERLCSGLDAMLSVDELSLSS
jgi:hypothetical protein